MTMTLISPVETQAGSASEKWNGYSAILPSALQVPTARATVLIVSPQALIRRGLEAVLGDGLERCRVRAVATAREAKELASRAEPSVIVLDTEMCEPAAAGAVCADLVAIAPGVRLVVVASVDAPATIRHCLAAGATGCISSDADESAIKAAFAAALRGQRYVDPRIAFAFVRNDDQMPALAASKLTPRERDVLRLLSEGCSNRTISSRLAISEKTVKGHVSSILAKLHAPSRLAAALMAKTVL